VEVWRDQRALDQHMTHAHTHEFLAAVPDLIAGNPTMRFFDAEPTKEEAR
jgi:quinol monooxygenase YgiN